MSPHVHLFLFLSAVTTMSSMPITEGARLIEANGYTGCVELTNAHTRVVLEPNLGGRVIKYQLDGVETLHQDPSLNGVVLKPGLKINRPAGGRCDIGPEINGHPREELWLGRWTAEITGPRSARLISQVTAQGIQLVREFTLAAGTSHLRFTQIIHNRGREMLRTYHWSRTFANGHGIALAPIPAHSRFPSGYVYYQSGTIPLRPEPEPNVRVRDGILEIIDRPANPKFALDVDPGWLGYLTRGGLLFVKKFAVYPERAYGEPAANNVSIWYDNEIQTEIEPIGPLELIPPGGHASFTEDWWLHTFPFPADRRPDLAKVRALVDASTP